MEGTLPQLPPPIYAALLQFVETLVQAFPLATAPAVPDRFPRTPIEILILETLEALWPMSASPLQVASMIRQPHLEVRTVLQALAVLGTIGHPHRGYYARYRLPEDTSRPSAGAPAQPNDSPPSARWAPQIAALCTPPQG